MRQIKNITDVNTKALTLSLRLLRLIKAITLSKAVILVERNSNS